MTIEYKDSKRITAVSSDWTADVTSNITWSTTGKVGYNISGTTITRTGSAGWSLSKIQSTDTFTVGNGKFMIEFSGNANDENSTQLGFNKGTLGYHHGSATPQNKADFAIYMAGGSQVEVYESGTKNYDSGGSRSASDRYRIEIDNDGLVKYYLQAGGTGSFDLKYTSSTTASGTYFIQANSHASTSVATVHSKTVNTAVAKPSNVQDNSILVEKDNARRYNEHIQTWDLLHTYPSDYKVIFVGDAEMSPYEITYPGGSVEYWNEESGETWINRMLNIYENAIWLNPIPERYWDRITSASIMKQLFSDRMFPLTIEGIDQAMRELNK